MINRVADEVFEDNALEKIFNNLKLNQKKLFSIVSSEEKAKELKANLNQKGYNSMYEEDNGFYNVFYSEKPMIKASKKVMSNFLDIGNQHFALNNRSAFAGIYDCAYDDGSIWTLQEIDGEQFLVKEIIGEDENNVIRRKKVASAVSALDTNIINAMKKLKLVVTPQSVNNIKQQLLMDLTNDTKKIASVVKQYAEG